jgi:acid phosphatase
MRNNRNLKIVAILLIQAGFALSVLGQNANFNGIPDSQLGENEIRFAAIGDAGTGSKDQYKTAQQMLQAQGKTNFNLLLFLGDNIYENGSPKDFEKKFIKPYAPLFKRGVEFRGVLGNHDARSENGVLLQQMILNMGTKTYYSFEKKDKLVEFFAIDSTNMVMETPPSETIEQLKWFEEALAKSTAKWKVVFLHHPLYSSADRHGLNGPDNEEMLRVRKLLEPLYIKYGVQISINGHDHVYERTKPQNGVNYFTSGAGGKLRKGNFKVDSPFFASGNDQVSSFMLFSIKPESIKFWAIGIDGKVLDSGLIQRKTKNS